MTLPIKTLPPPPVRGYYARRVLECGHRPGVLSGAELRGKAKQYSGRYYDIRRRVIDYAAQHEVYSCLVLHPRSSRYTRVWTDESGQRVRIIIAE